MIWFLLWYIFWLVVTIIHDDGHRAWTVGDCVSILLLGWIFCPIFAVKDTWDSVKNKVVFEKKGLKRGKA